MSRSSTLNGGKMSDIPATWDHSENLKSCAFIENVHLEREILYDLYILGTE